MVHVHIIGAGLAGLSSAIRSIEKGHSVSLYDAAVRPGGRCRSFMDDTLGLEIDNGNHFTMGCNKALFRYLDTVGARDELIGLDPPVHPFLDLRSGTRWAVHPGHPLSLWMLNKNRRTKDSSLWDHLSAVNLAMATDVETVALALEGVSDAAMEGLYEPACEAILNTQTSDGSAKLLWEVFKRSFMKGTEAARLYIAKESLQQTLVDPAVAFIEAAGGTLHLNQAVKNIEVSDHAARQIIFRDQTVDLSSGDVIILAVPAWASPISADTLATPDLGHRAILNAHFAVEDAMSAALGGPLLGLVGSTAQWLVRRPGLVSVTVSAADRFMTETSENLAQMLWKDVAAALGRPDAPCPAHRIIKEKRATIAHTPDVVLNRPSAKTPISNVARAGDWTDTGLPCTIEGAIQSGETAVTALSL